MCRKLQRRCFFASKKRHLLCRTFKFRFLSEKSRFHFLCCFCFKSEIRVSAILDKPSLGISNSKSLISVCIAENVSSKIICGGYLDLLSGVILVCWVIFGTFLNLWLTLDPLKRSILAPIRDRSEYSTFQWIQRQPEVHKSLKNCSTDAFSGIFF